MHKRKFCRRHSFCFLISYLQEHSGVKSYFPYPTDCCFLFSPKFWLINWQWDNKYAARKDKMVVLSLCVFLRRHCAAVIGNFHCHSDVYFAPGGHMPSLRFTSLAQRGTLSRSKERHLHLDKHLLKLHHLGSRRLYSTTAKMASNGNLPTSGCRSINFQDYDAFGFDLDHTIAKYKLVELFNVSPPIIIVS